MTKSKITEPGIYFVLCHQSFSPFGLFDPDSKYIDHFDISSDFLELHSREYNPNYWTSLHNNIGHLMNRMQGVDGVYLVMTSNALMMQGFGDASKIFICDINGNYKRISEHENWDFCKGLLTPLEFWVDSIYGLPLDWISKD